MIAGGLIGVGADLALGSDVAALGVSEGRRSFFTGSEDAGEGTDGMIMLAFRPGGFVVKGLILDMILILGAAIGGGASVTGVGGR